jgi:hypothetical protein
MVSTHIHWILACSDHDVAFNVRIGNRRTSPTSMKLPMGLGWRRLRLDSGTRYVGSPPADYEDGEHREVEELIVPDPYVGEDYKQYMGN